jgi:hypothetical protein
MSRRLKDKFRARDDDGNEYEVEEYDNGAGALVTAEGRPVSGPLAGLSGQTFTVAWDEGDNYEIFIGPNSRKITRIR